MHTAQQLEASALAIAGAIGETVDRAASLMTARDLAWSVIPYGPGKWTPRQVIGHLIDSAANNHQRFVRAQESDPRLPAPYAQEHWVAVQGYEQAPWPELVELWRLYNRHLARVIGRIPAPALARSVRIGDADPVTLGWLVEDYLAHMQKHLRLIGLEQAAPTQR